MESQNKKPVEQARGSAAKRGKRKAVSDTRTSEESVKKVNKLEIRRASNQNAWIFAYAGGGELPKALQGRFTSHGVAERTLDTWRRSTYPEHYASSSS